MKKQTPPPQKPLGYDAIVTKCFKGATIGWHSLIGWDWRRGLFIVNTKGYKLQIWKVLTFLGIPCFTLVPYCLVILSVVTNRKLPNGTYPENLDIIISVIFLAVNSAAVRMNWLVNVMGQDFAYGCNMLQNMTQRKNARKGFLRREKHNTLKAKFGESLGIGFLWFCRLSPFFLMFGIFYNLDPMYYIFGNGHQHLVIVFIIRVLVFFICATEVCRTYPILLSVMFMAILKIQDSLAYIMRTAKYPWCLRGIAKDYRSLFLINQVVSEAGGSWASTALATSLLLSVWSNIMTFKMHAIITMPLYGYFVGVTIFNPMLTFSALYAVGTMGEDSHTLKRALVMTSYTMGGRRGKELRKLVESIQPLKYYGSLGQYNLFDITKSFAVRYNKSILDGTINAMISVKAQGVNGSNGVVFQVGF